MPANDIQLLKKVIRDLLEESLNERKKPGGPITDYGALRILNKKKADAEARKALKTAKGDVSDAAQAVGVADRTFYHYLETDPKLEKAQVEAEKTASSDATNTSRPEAKPKSDSKKRVKPRLKKSRRAKSAAEKAKEFFGRPKGGMNPDIEAKED